MRGQLATLGFALMVIFGVVAMGALPSAIVEAMNARTSTGPFVSTLIMLAATAVALGGLGLLIVGAGLGDKR